MDRPRTGDALAGCIVTSPAATIDSRVGGKYHFCMRSPEGQDFWSTGVYQEITPMDRTIYTDSFSDPA